MFNPQIILVHCLNMQQILTKISIYMITQLYNEDDLGPLIFTTIKCRFYGFLCVCVCYTVYDKIFTKMFAKGIYWDKNFAKFNFINCVNYLPGSRGWSLQVAMCICACTHDCANVSKSSLCKKIHGKKNCQQYALVKLVKIFLWRKFPCIRYYKKHNEHVSEKML